MKHARSDYNNIQEIAGTTPHIPKDEPVFLIRGQDRIGALVVRIWSVLNVLFGGNLKISKVAWDHAKLMARWPRKKKADL